MAIAPATNAAGPNHSHGRCASLTPQKTPRSRRRTDLPSGRSRARRTPRCSARSRPGCRIRLPTLFLWADTCLLACSWPCLGRGRDLHAEDRALPVVRLDPDAPTDPADELAGDVEAQARAPDPAGHVGIEAVELLED